LLIIRIAIQHDNMTKEDTNRVFDFIDRDRDGKISVRDLKIASQDLGEELSGKFKFYSCCIFVVGVHRLTPVVRRCRPSENDRESGY
jgi:hypothetical protein